jgi:acyl carrier protein
VGGEKTLIGYVVGNGVQAQELRNYLAGKLPEYMLPSMFVNLPELPLTPNRKLDWNSLPTPDETYTIAGEQNFPPARTALEGKLLEIVAGLLGLERVGVDDDFFLIGGHSLFCTQLVARIRDTFGVDLALRSVFEASTPAQLAQQIESLIATKIGAMNADEVQHALKEATFAGGRK